MHKENHPPRIPKGSKEGGRSMPKWAAELRKSVADLHNAINGSRGLTEEIEAHDKAIAGLYSRLGTSTPLIIWNIAVLIAIACIAAKVWGYAPY